MPYCPLAISLCMLVLAVSPASAEMPVVLADDFEQGMDRWQPLEAEGWKIKQTDDGNVLSQFDKRSSYKPPHRSPYHIALAKDAVVGDFDLTVRVRSTHPSYGHRDACLFFGVQDAAHFYYVHLGQKTDAHANQIFIVNDAARTKISTATTDGTPWDDAWHTVRIVRRVADGTSEVYFDDMLKPAMTAKDTTFAWGQVGVGSFDDTADWDDVQLRGKTVARAE